MRIVGIALAGLLLGGCGSIYLKHPENSAVVECNGPGIVLVKVLVRDSCVARWQARGYAVVEKCKDAAPGALCVRDDEREP